MSTEANLPAIHILHIIDVVKRWNVTAESVLEGTGLVPESLAIPDLKLPISTHVTVIDRARKLTNQPALGIIVGLEMKASWHGFLGFAAMSAETLGDALELASKFAPTRTSAIELELARDGDTASLIIYEKTDLGSARDALLFSLVVGFAQIGSSLVGHMPEGHTEFSFPEPDYFGPFREMVAGSVEFSRPVTRLDFEASILERPMPWADAGALALARRQCEAQLEAIAKDSDVVTQVRDRIGTLEREAIAKELGMSPRTLKRRLADAGTTFSELVAIKRSNEAMKLLKTDRSIDAVADELGYADRQSFSRAFRRWTGMTPSAYRKSV